MTQSRAGDWLFVKIAPNRPVIGVYPSVGSGPQPVVRLRVPPSAGQGHTTSEPPADTPLLPPSCSSNSPTSCLGPATLGQSMREPCSQSMLCWPAGDGGVTWSLRAGTGGSAVADVASDASDVAHTARWRLMVVNSRAGNSGSLSCGGRGSNLDVL